MNEVKPQIVSLALLIASPIVSNETTGKTGKYLIIDDFHVLFAMAKHGKLTEAFFLPLYYRQDTSPCSPITLAAKPYTGENALLINDPISASTIFQVRHNALFPLRWSFFREKYFQHVNRHKTRPA